MLRKTFHREELKQHFDKTHLDNIWSHLIYQRPYYFQAVWVASGCAQCAQQTLAHGWCKDSAYLRLRNGLITFHWALGDRITNELMSIGQNPMLAALMGIQEPILDTNNVSETVDLQSVLLLTVVRGIAKAQTFMDQELMMMQLIDELNLGKDLMLAAAETAVKVELFRSLEVRHES